VVEIDFKFYLNVAHIIKRREL
jgi:hypothetical protein